MAEVSAICGDTRTAVWGDSDATAFTPMNQPERQETVVQYFNMGCVSTIIMHTGQHHCWSEQLKIQQAAGEGPATVTLLVTTAIIHCGTALHCTAHNTLTAE